MLEGLVAAEVLDSVIVAHAQTQQAQVALDHVTGAHAQRGGEAAVDAVDASDLEALPDDGQPGVAGEGAATGAELYVGHGTVWVNGDNGYIAMQVSGLEVLPGAGLTDSGDWHGTVVVVCHRNQYLCRFCSACHLCAKNGRHSHRYPK